MAHTTTTGTCSKCDGHGRIEAFSHVANGVCFWCEGTGRLSITSPHVKPAAKPIMVRTARILGHDHVVERKADHWVVSGRMTDDAGLPSQSYGSPSMQIYVYDDGETIATDGIYAVPEHLRERVLSASRAACSSLAK